MAMKFFYDPSARGFHIAASSADVPATAIEIGADLHGQLMEAQATGKAIEPDATGMPVAIDPPLPVPELALQLLRDRRTRLLQRSDYTQMPDAPLTEAERAKWRAYRQALRDLPETTSDLAAVVWPAAPA